MAISLKIDIDGILQARNLLSRMRARTMNLRPAMQDFGERMRMSIIRNFQVGGRPKRWLPSKRARLHGGKTLVDTGRLRNSITYKAGNKDLTVGTSVKYARILQFGGPAHDVKIVPKRAKALAIKIFRPAFERMTRRGRVRTERPKNIIFRKSAMIRAGAIPPRPFLLFQKEDIEYAKRRIIAFVTGRGH